MKFAYSSMKRSCWQIHPISIYMGLNAASLSSFIHSTVCTVRKYILCTYLVNRSKILQVAGTWAECKTAGCCCCKKILYTFSHEYSALNRSRDLWLLDTKSCYGLLMILFRKMFARLHNLWMFWFSWSHN